MSYPDKRQESYQEELDMALLQLCCNRLESTRLHQHPSNTYREVQPSYTAEA